jgi:DNA topoisomerase-1
VSHSVSITDRRLARIVQRCQDLPGQELFQYLDSNGKRQTVSSGDVNGYLQDITGGVVTAKDFRTWAGTMLAARELRSLGPAPTQKEAERNVVRAIDAVAQRLGNTRAVCRKYYVHPVLLSAYFEAPSGGKKWWCCSFCRRDEVAVSRQPTANGRWPLAVGRW